MYYVSEHTYEGPNPNDNLNYGHILITDYPMVGNSSCEPIIDGWCGTTNDHCIHAHGEYETIEEARKFVAENFVTRDIEGAMFYDPSEIEEIYGLGAHELMSERETADWVLGGYLDITADTTDEQIDEQIDDYVSGCLQEYNTLLDRGTIQEILTSKRDEMREEDAEND